MRCMRSVKALTEINRSANEPERTIARKVTRCAGSFADRNKTRFDGGKGRMYGIFMRWMEAYSNGR